VADAGVSVGSVKIKKMVMSSPHTNDSADISNLIVEFNFYESIFQPFPTGNLIILDASSLFTIFPLTGDETLDVDFEVDSPAFQKKPYKKKFRVASITNLTVEREVRTVQYRMHVVATEAPRDWQTHIRKSYANMPTSNMVKEIAKNFLGISEIEVDETEGKRTIVIPALRPTDAIKMLCRESKSPQYQESDFYFWGTADKYYFKALAGMYKPKEKLDVYTLVEKNKMGSEAAGSSSPQPSPGTSVASATQEGTPVTATPTAAAGADGGGTVNPTSGTGGTGTGADGAGTGTGTTPTQSAEKPKEWLKVNAYRFEKIFDLEEKVKQGAFDNEVITIDPAKSLYETTKWNFKTGWDKLKHIDEKGGKPIFEKSELNNLQGKSHLRFIISNHDSEKQVPDLKYQILGQRAAAGALLGYVRLHITIPGDNTRRVGDLIDVTFPEFSRFEKTKEKENLYLAGTYFITAVRHAMSAGTGSQYITIMECVKNQFHTKPEQYQTLRDSGSNSSTTPSTPTPTNPDGGGGMTGANPTTSMNPSTNQIIPISTGDGGARAGTPVTNVVQDT